MTFKNTILAYLGFCPSKESAQDFRVRNKAITLKQKEYRDAIIGGIGGGIGGTIVLYILRREVPWAFLFTYPIFYAPANLYFNKRREAKKEEDVLGGGG
jgi:hypothetical protein